MQFSSVFSARKGPECKTGLDKIRPMGYKKERVLLRAGEGVQAEKKESLTKGDRDDGYF